MDLKDRRALERELNELKKSYRDILNSNIKLSDELRWTKEDKERLTRRIERAIEYINENWGHWCSNHCKYATETINILKGSDSDE